MRPRVVGIGCRLAGDDGVGLAVIEALEQERPRGVDLFAISEPTQLVDILVTDEPVLVVDALLNPPLEGAVVVIEPERLASSLSSGSSHSVDVATVIALARALEPSRVTRRVVVVGIGIALARRECAVLSAPVGAAVPRAVATIHALLSAMAEDGPCQPLMDEESEEDAA